jgi:hypothetical protein
MKAKDLFFLVGLLSCFTATRILAQINVGVSNTPSVVNAYYPISAISGNVVTVGTGTGISHTLAIGDKVLLVQMTGNTAVNGGKFEYRTVTAVSGSDINLDGITRTYTTSEKVQLVWIPYDPIGITIIANILAKPWDGSTGGIVGVLTDGTLTMNGSILADGAGFRGLLSVNDLTLIEANYIFGEGVYGGGGGGGYIFEGAGGGGGYGISTGATGQGGTGGGIPASASGGGFNNGINSGVNGGGGGSYGNYNNTGGNINGGFESISSLFPVAGGGCGGGGGVGGGGGGGSAGPHGGGGGGGASISRAGCGGIGADNPLNIGGIGAINGGGWTNGTYVGGGGGFSGGGGGGGGGAYNGGGGGSGYGGILQYFGGEGGGFVPTSGYHTFFSCDASGNCSDPRIWMAGGAQNGIDGGGIVMIKANQIITNGQVITANGEDGTSENIINFSSSFYAYGGGGGGLIVINANQITGTLALCAKGGNGVQGLSDNLHGWGSSGGGGNGVIWVNNPLGGVSSNINATATPPVVTNMSFCTDGGLGGTQAPNPKSATFSGGGGCGGGGVIQVNPNAVIFGPTSTCSISLTANAGTCNTSNNQYTLTGNLTITNAPTSGTLTVSVSGGGSVSYPVSSLPATYSITGLNADGVSHTVTATFSDDTSCTNTATFTAPIACGSNPCPSPNCGSLSVQKNN